MRIQSSQRGIRVDVVEWNVDTQEIMGDGDVPSFTPSLARFLSNIVDDLMTGMILWITGCRESGR